MLVRALFRLEIPVDDAESVQVVERERELREIELDVLLREHDLHTQDTTDKRTGRLYCI